MMRTASATRIGLPRLRRVCDRGDSPGHGQLMESPWRCDKAQKQCVGRSERGSSRSQGLERVGAPGALVGGPHRLSDKCGASMSSLCFGTAYQVILNIGKNVNKLCDFCCSNLECSYIFRRASQLQEGKLN